MCLKDTLVRFLEETRQPTVKELKECCSYLVETGKETQPGVAQKLERAESYACRGLEDSVPQAVQVASLLLP